MMYSSPVCLFERAERAERAEHGEPSRVATTRA
jgi:hypothetical protein